MFKKTKGLVNEFKNFIMRGNVIDMAVGVIIAGAFGKITTSLVNDVFMPFIGWIIGGFDLSKLNIISSVFILVKIKNNIVTVNIIKIALILRKPSIQVFLQ